MLATTLRVVLRQQHGVQAVCVLTETGRQFLQELPVARQGPIGRERVASAREREPPEHPRLAAPGSTTLEEISTGTGGGYDSEDVRYGRESGRYGADLTVETRFFSSCNVHTREQTLERR